MKLETLLSHRRDAVEMIEAMKHDVNLQKVYSDYNFYRFINKCDELIKKEKESGEWYEDVVSESPF